MSLTFLILKPEAFIQCLPELAQIYRQAFSGPPYFKPSEELESFTDEATEHSSRPGFQSVAAFENGPSGPPGQPVGFTYGYQLLPNYWWYQQVQPHLARFQQADWLQDSFELTQMAVLPEYQGQGIGGRLHDRLLANLPYSHGLLSTLFGETNASALYRRRGWQVLLEPFEFSEVPRPYRIMGQDLRSSKR